MADEREGRWARGQRVTAGDRGFRVWEKFFEEEMKEEGSDEPKAPKLRGKGDVMKDGGHGVHCGDR